MPNVLELLSRLGVDLLKAEGQRSRHAAGLPQLELQQQTAKTAQALKELEVQNALNAHRSQQVQAAKAGLDIPSFLAQTATQDRERQARQDEAQTKNLEAQPDKMAFDQQMRLLAAQMDAQRAQQGEEKLRQGDERIALMEQRLASGGGDSPQSEPGAFAPFQSADGKMYMFNAKSGRMVPVPEVEGQQLLRPLTAGEKKDHGALETLLEDVGTVEQLVSDPKMLASIGPVQGRLTRLRRATVGTSPEEATLLRLTENMADQLLRARSGAQINESEFRRLRPLVPSVNDPDVNFPVALGLFRSELERTLKNRFRATPGTASSRPAASNPTPTSAPAPAPAQDPDPLGLFK